MPEDPNQADGPLYVDRDCCLACGVPQHFAPDIFGLEGDELTCRVLRQPRGRDELGRVIEVLDHQEFDCVRYIGGPEALRVRLESENLADLWKRLVYWGQ